MDKPMTPNEVRNAMFEANTKAVLQFVFNHEAYENLPVKEAKRHAEGISDWMNRAASEYHQSMTIAERNAGKAADPTK